MTEDASAPMNSPDYWDRRFATDWAANDGPEQTRFFARLGTMLLPSWLRDDIVARRLSIHDLGCAEGDALPVLSGMFGASKISGSDVSRVAIDIARNRHPKFDFSVIKGGRASVKADVIFCSNTIEHLTDWRDKLDEFAMLAAEHLIVLAPFREVNLFKEHVTSFDFDMIPATLGQGMKLAHVSVRTTTDMPGTRWIGQQFFAVWSRNTVGVTSGQRGPTGTLDDIDFRSVPADAIPACLALAKGTFPILDETRASLHAQRRTNEEAKSYAAFKWTERENEFTSIRVGLENQLHETRVALDMAKHTGTTALGMAEFKVRERENEFTSTHVTLENQLHTARVALDMAKHEAATAMGQAQAKWVERENEFTNVRVGLENALHRARVALEDQKHEAEQTRVQAEAKRIERENEFITKRVALENELHLARVALENEKHAAKIAREQAELRLETELKLARAALQSEAEAKRLGAVATAQTLGELEDFKRRVDSMSKQQLEDLQSIHLALVGQPTDSDAAPMPNPQVIRDQILTLRQRLERLQSQTILLDGQIATATETARADMARLEAQVSDLKAEQTAAREAARATVERFNTQLAARERSLQASFDTLRQNYSRVTTMRPFLLMMKAVNVYTRVRRIRFTLPPASERLATTLPRLDVSKVFSPPDQNTFGREARPPVAAPIAQTRATDAPRLSATVPTAPPRDVPVILLQAGALDRGGLEQVVFDHATAFKARGETVVVFAIERGGEIAERLIQAGIHVEAFGGFEAAAYRRAVETLKIKAAYLHANLDGVDILAQSAVPTIEVIHNTYHWLQGDAAGYRAKAQHVKRFIAVSSGVADFHADVFGVPRDQIEVVNNALNPDGFVRPERHLLTWARRNWRQQFTFVHVAQFLPPKGHAALVSAFAEVHAKHPHARLRLIGAAADTDTFAHVQALIAKRGLRDVVDLPGFLDRRHLSRALAAAHVFVQPSVFEGFSVAKTEAAYFGLPMILTAVGGAADMIKNEDCGLVIEPPLKTLKGVSPAKVLSTGLSADASHVPALAAAMTRMLTDYEAWAPRGFVGAARAEALTLDAVMDRYQAIATPLATAQSE